LAEARKEPNFLTTYLTACTVIDFYTSRLERPDLALEIYEEMKRVGTVKSTLPLNALIESFGKTKKG
jgi:hypothetical protein